VPPTHCAVPGTLLNANTLDDFKERDKAALLQGVARAIWDDVASGAALAQPERLLRFLLLTFADLKTRAQQPSPDPDPDPDPDPTPTPTPDPDPDPNRNPEPDRHKYYYWFAFPAFAMAPPTLASPPTPLAQQADPMALHALRTAYGAMPRGENGCVPAF